MGWSKVCTAFGLLLLAAALSLTAYNLWSDAEAGKTADAVVGQLAAQVEEEGDAAGVGVPTERPSAAQAEETSIPDYILNPEMAMPEVEIDGLSYIGVLRIPTLSLELPVVSEWSYPALKISPCRYVGSVYQNNMVIAAHNYTSHFGQLKTLSPGDEVTFTDVDGNVFRYRVVELETLSPYAIEEMTSGDWDLTLFTCTIGGQTRVTVRCELAGDA